MTDDPAAERFTPETRRDLLGMVRDWRRLRRRIVALLSRPEDQYRTPLLNRVAKASATIAARSGVVKGSGTVTLYVDDGSGTGTDKVLQAGVKVWNPYSQPIASGTWVVLVVRDGLLQIDGADCPGTSS